MIVAVAMKTKEGKIRVCRNCHVELMMLFPDEFKDAEQGFLTSDCRFVDRVEGLAIAKKYNQIIVKHGLDTELYSEDIFMKKDTSKEIETIVNYCRKRECEECPYHTSDDMCDLHNPTAWNV